MKCATLFLFLLVEIALTSAVSPGTASARPLDLYNTEPRSLIVAFEVSPRDAPSQIDTEYSRELPAYLEPGSRAGEVRVSIAAEMIERYLLPGENPVPGSFSDFVWTFDIETGHVVSATLTGRVTRRLDWGFTTTRASADIEVDMGTARVAGFKPATRLLGQLFFKHCESPKKRKCTLVEATPFDANTGYVNAVGRIRIRSYIMNLLSFSPLGEARFLEADEPLETHAAVGDPTAQEIREFGPDLPLDKAENGREDLRPSDLN